YLQALAGIMVGLPLVVVSAFGLYTAPAYGRTPGDGPDTILLVLLVLFGLAGIILTFCGAVLLKVRRDFRRLVASDVIANSLGSDVYELQSIAEESGIDPVYIMGGTAYYDPAE